MTADDVAARVREHPDYSGRGDSVRIRPDGSVDWGMNVSGGGEDKDPHENAGEWGREFAEWVRNSLPGWEATDLYTERDYVSMTVRPMPDYPVREG